MRKNDILKQVRKERKEMKKWNKLDRGHYSKLMYDKADGDIWADCFLDEGSYTVYHSETICSVPIGDLVYQHSAEKVLTEAEIIEIITNYIIKNLNAGVLQEDK